MQYNYPIIKPKNELTSVIVSVVIVTYDGTTMEELTAGLDSLTAQNTKDFEILLVDTGTKNPADFVNYNLSFIKVADTKAVSHGRNVGIAFAKAPIVAMFDDDALADKNWISSIINAFVDPKIIAIRGRVKPKTPKNIYNKMAAHYDLGDKPVNATLSTECNCAIRRESTVAVNGFDVKLFGGEGMDLHFRLSQKYPGSKVVYVPGMVVFHDFADSLVHYFNKSVRHGRTIRLLKQYYPELLQFSSTVTDTNINPTNKLALVPKLFLQLIAKIGFKIGYTKKLI